MYSRLGKETARDESTKEAAAPASLHWHVSYVSNGGMTQRVSLRSEEIIASGHGQFGRTVLTCCQRSADKQNEDLKGGRELQFGSGSQGSFIYTLDIQMKIVLRNP